ncbi:hypothetical protein Tfer_0882 [Thermincola ferriacetica]|uniref:Uncharacterized protein n=1 Tax=Thermincola ferriacetica TaxID=281456 RepID=A0A0L6W415_9FIRM|nr:hypothetical protein [Thermincola ferriacetica]KNZ70322.1 hypothetical protein Tfer_0882 [Thermincola ferriacetica]
MSLAKKTSVSLEPSIVAQLDTRGPRSTVINRDLERLYKNPGEKAHRL